MSNELKKIKETRRKLREIDYDSILVQLVRIPDDVRDAKLAEWKRQRAELAGQLDRLESDYIIKKAQSWGIEVPRKQEWYVGHFKNPDPDNIPGETIAIEQEWLNDIGKAVITKQIRDARFAYWKGWVDLLIPILALVVALIALLK